MNVPDVDRFFPDYSRAVESLKRAFVPDKGMPLALHDRNKCFASTTATSLLALYRIGAIGKDQLLEFQHTLMGLRGKSRGILHRDNPPPAWDAQEGPSVWSTSNALWALASTGCDKGNLVAAVNWVIQAYGRTPGFGSQRTDANLFISAYAAQGLRIAADSDSARGILRDLVDWVRRTALKNGAWSAAYRYDPDGEPDPTATLCALWILKDNGDPQGEDNRRIEGGLTYLRGALKGSPGVWPMAGVPPVYVHKDESGLTLMSIDSFTPSFVIPLLRMNVDPYDPLILEPIRWLQRHIMTDPYGFAGWDSVETNPTWVKSYATAFALWAVHNWAKAVARSARKEVSHDRAASIFIVHGRDEHALESLTGQLATWKAPPAVIVKDDPNALETIFTRVTHAARHCDYALILATPDDRGYLASNPQFVEARARQNVMLELGLFLGLLGSRRMSLLTKGAPNLPSDLGGVMSIDMDQPDWTTQLYRTLRAAGVL